MLELFIEATGLKAEQQASASTGNIASLCAFRAQRAMAERLQVTAQQIMQTPVIDENALIGARAIELFTEYGLL
jgi:hypothetical protein